MNELKDIPVVLKSCVYFNFVGPFIAHSMLLLDVEPVEPGESSEGAFSEIVRL